MARTQASDKKGKPKGGSKAQSSSAAAAATPTSARVAKPMTGTNGDFAALVRELGGDEDDLKLLAGVDSDDEGGEVIYSGNAPNEAQLSNELSKFMTGLDFSKFASGAQDDSDLDSVASDADVPTAKVAAAAPAAADDSESEGEMIIEGKKKTKKEVEEVVRKEKKENEVKKAREGETLAGLVEGANFDGAVGKPKKGDYIFPPIPQWYMQSLPDLPATSKPLPQLTPSLLTTLSARSSLLLSALPTTQPAPSSSAADKSFLSKILRSGTHSDKLSALILLVQADPVRNVGGLEGLRGMMGWKKDESGNGGTVGRMGGREERVGVVRAVVDWFVGGGAPDRKLRYLRDQPQLTHPKATDAHLIVWAFEDFLKRYFFTLLQVLETLSHDTLPFIRTQAIGLIYVLLKQKPEQEQNLLRMLVNKLGDTEKTVASRASYHLLQLLQTHPAMKTVVVREVSSLVLAPPPPKAVEKQKQAPKKKGKGGKGKAGPAAAPAGKDRDDGNYHARYYGLITLNQTTLTQKDGEVAGKLCEVYFEVFRGILGDGKEQDKEEKLAEKAKADEAAQNEREGKAYRNKGKGKGKGGPAEDVVEDEDAKMIAAVLTGVNRAVPFAKIDDAALERHMDTLFRITHSGTFNISIQALGLIYQVTAAREAVSDRFYRTLYDSLLDPRLASSSKQALYLNLLFKAIKGDNSLPRQSAFIKRVIQILSLHQAQFICGALFLMGEVFTAAPGLRRLVAEPEDDDEEEHFVDAPDSDAEESEKLKPAPEKKWSTVYDGKKREPQYAHAENSCLWELVPFLSHFHPSVSLLASQLIDGVPLTGSADLNLNTLIHFLDRFVYRNAKKLKAKGASIMQPAAVSDKTGVVLNLKGPGTGMEVNSKEFWSQNVEDVPVDQLFFHKFFTQKNSKARLMAEKAAKRKKGGDDDDDMAESDDEDLPRSAPAAEGAVDDAVDDGEDEVNSDDEEAEVWKAMQKSMPEITDDADLMEDDSDDDLSSLDEDEAAAAAEFEDMSDMESVDTENEELVGAQDDGDGSLSEGGSDGVMNDAEFDSEDDEAFELDEDEDDLLDEDEMPDIELPGMVDGEETSGKRKRAGEDDKKEKRKKKAKLPLWGSYEDYQKLIDDGGPEDNI